MKNIQSKIVVDNSSNKSIFTKLVEGIILFKSLILKITLIALLIKIFRKYKIFRVLWRFTNWVIVSLFGFSVMDIYGINFISDIFTYLRESSIYLWISSLLGNQSEVKNIPSRLKTINHDTTRNESNETLVQRIKEIIHREPEVITEDETPIYKNRYVITVAILLLLGLTYWGFKDSIDPVISDSIDKLQIFRSGANRNSTTISQDVVRPIEESNKSWWTGLTDKIKSWWNKDNTSNAPDSPDSKILNKENWKKYFKGEPGPSNLQNYNDLKGKAVDQSNLSEWEKTRRLLDQITGENKNQFDLEASSILGQMNTFIINHENNTFPENLWLVQGMYTAIHASLTKLRFSSDVLWKELLKDEDKRALIDKFQTEIYKEIGLDYDHKTMKYNNPELIKPQYKQDILDEYKKAESATYEEVANATIYEQDNWSNRGSLNSPHDHISEIGLFDNTTEQVEIPELNVRNPKLSYAETLDKVQNVTTDVPDTPKISEKAGSTLGEYLEATIETDEFLRQKIKELEEGPKPVPLDLKNLKSKFTNLFDAIKSRRDDSHVVDGSQVVDSSKDDKLTSLIEDAKVLSDEEILEKVTDIKGKGKEVESLTPRPKSPSSSSPIDYFIERETQYFNDEDIEKVVIQDVKDTNLVITETHYKDGVKGVKISEAQDLASTSKLQDNPTEEVKASGSSDLFKQIKSNRKEYGTPVIETREELLKQAESHVNSPKVETPSIVVDKEESLPGILESVKGLNRQNTGGKESLFNVGLSPRLEKSPSLHRAPSISNLFDDTQNLFVDDDDSTNTPFNVELANWNDTKVKVDQAGGLFSVDFGDKLKDVQELHITLNSGKIHILENNLENNKDFIFKWGDSDKNLDILNIDVLDKNNNNSRIYVNSRVKILPNFELTHKASLNSFANYKIKE